MEEKQHRKYISRAQTHFWASWQPWQWSMKGLSPFMPVKSKVSDFQSWHEGKARLRALASDLLATSGEQTETSVANVEMFLNRKKYLAMWYVNKSFNQIILRFDLIPQNRKKDRVRLQVVWAGLSITTTKAAKYFLMYLFLIPTPSPKAVPMSACEKSRAWRNPQTSLTSDNYSTVSVTVSRLEALQESGRGIATRLLTSSSSFYYFS